MPNALDYYPSEKYIRKNWAPEKFDADMLREIAQAQKLAVKTGVLSPAVGSQFLPAMLAEGSSDLGAAGYQYPPNELRDNALRLMGLRVGDSVPIPANVDTSNWGDAEYADFSKANNVPDIIRTKGGYDFQGETDRERARMAAVIMAEKARLYGDDKAVERYNGKGVSYSEGRRADASNHARKVHEMARMLNHPKNALLRQTYEQMLKGQ